MQKQRLDIVERRLQHDASLPQSFCACKAPDEARRVYRAFPQTAADDYRKEHSELAKLGGTLANEALHVLQATSAENASAVSGQARSLRSIDSSPGS